MSQQGRYRGGKAKEFTIGHITMADLPPRDTVRWVSSRKATVVEAVQCGVITLADACSRYALSLEEFLSWQRALEQGGTPGLRATNPAKPKEH
ncbi:hypothetical protein FHS83_003656 [Rhizomicrobium palustre]|uniref:DUF1153 domain-containing protein n=2 Tax=Rhizomicrobium palustre TaxID=189966 RepID=A0A846N307_9PROT|nr:DUF1153 domain-containing protein [Rhizomicrobium palustre]NIK90338.1 hypothetical protein [Rhizomicrobium palustre]